MALTRFGVKYLDHFLGSIRGRDNRLVPGMLHFLSHGVVAPLPLGRSQGFGKLNRRDGPRRAIVRTAPRGRSVACIRRLYLLCSMWSNRRIGIILTHVQSQQGWMKKCWSNERNTSAAMEMIINSADALFEERSAAVTLHASSSLCLSSSPLLNEHFYMTNQNEGWY